MAEKEAKPDLASLVADIAKEECRKLHEKRLTGLEEELVALQDARRGARRYGVSSRNDRQDKAAWKPREARSM